VAEVLDTSVDGAALGPLRVALGLLLFWQAITCAREVLGNGYFGDTFHTSLVPEAFVAAKPTFIALVAARAVLAALVVVGVRARPALALSGLLALYTLATNTLDFHHNRYALALYVCLLSLTPCDRSWLLLDGDEPKVDRTGLGFGLWLCRFQVAIVYLASGGSKLLDADWRAGTVLRERFLAFGGEAEARGVPHALLETLGSAMGSSVLAKAAIVTEIALAFMLFFRRTKAPALWLALVFHATIQLTSRVEVFSALAVAMLVVFARPDARARAFRYDPRSGPATALAKVVRATDWLSRFEVKPWEPDGLSQVHAVVVVRRDGSRATKLAAFAMVARAIPLFFPLWAPLAFAASFTKGGDVGTDV